MPRTPQPDAAAFRPTRWSLVARAAAPDEAASRAALDEICRDYWYPLYAHARRSGLAPEDAEDAVQSFMASLVERNRLADADPARGKLRTFLLTGLKFTICDWRDHTNRQRRGGGVKPLSIDRMSAEDRYAHEPADPETPDRLFERRWAQTVMGLALRSLEEERTALRKQAEFAVLRDFLTPGSGAAEDYAGAAARLGWTVNAARVAVHRLRGRLREHIRGEVASTLENPDPRLIDEELAALVNAL